MLEQIAGGDDLIASLVEGGISLTSLFDSTIGAAVVHQGEGEDGGKIRCVGTTPAPAVILALAGLIRPRLMNGVFTTDHLAGLFPDGSPALPGISGLLVISVGENDGDLIMWFQPEVVSTTIWAGATPAAVEGQLTAQQMEFIGYAVDGASRMDKMIIDLLDYAQIGRKSPDMAPVGLGEVLSNALTNLGAVIARTGAEVLMDPAMPTVPGNSTELERLFQNLIANAIKFHGPSQPPKVAIEWIGNSTEVVVTVRDNGIGIPAGDFERIFSIFQRLDTPQRAEGTGIGLAACRKIVDHHHGRIWVDSVLGEGSSFRVALPCATQHSPPDTPPQCRASNKPFSRSEVVREQTLPDISSQSDPGHALSGRSGGRSIGVGHAATITNERAAMASAAPREASRAVSEIAAQGAKSTKVARQLVAHQCVRVRRVF